MSRETARRFHFLREIASGGFGSVYLCKVSHADGFSRLVAVKLLKTQWADSVEVTRRIRDEARLLGLLRHRNIVDVIDLTSLDGRAAIIMEYLEAVDLRAVIQWAEKAHERIPVRAALDIAAAVASALDAAYNRPPIPGEKPLRVIHRDIKPSNVMVDDTGMVKVLDFGVARSEFENRESHTQELQFGSVDYMAPERLFFEPETPASDVYSLAATLYELLALEKLGKARGRPERHAAHVSDRLSYLHAQAALRGSAATEVTALLRESLAFEHENRPSAAEFHQRARALARLIEGDDLVTWAERVLPPLIREAQEAPQAPNPLTDSVLTEDSLLFNTSDDSGGRDIPGSVVVRPGDALPEGGPHPSVSIGAELQLGVMAEFFDSTEDFVPAPATGAPAARAALAQAAEEERPTGVAEPSESPPARSKPSVSQAEGEEAASPQPAKRRGARSAAHAFPEEQDASSGESAQTRPAPQTKDSAASSGHSALRDERSIEATEPEAAEPATVVSAADAASRDALARRRASWLVGLFGGCLLAMVGLAGVVAAFVADVGGFRSSTVDLMRGTGPRVASASEAASPGADDASLPAAASPAPSLRFESIAEGTRKVTARCDESSGKGKLAAVVPLGSARICTVTAILADDRHLVAVVDAPTAGTYVCFAKGASRCERR